MMRTDLWFFLGIVGLVIIVVLALAFFGFI